MRFKNMILAGCALALGLASCEMKDELLDKGGNASGEMGVLDLSLAVNAANNVVTKATVDGGTEVDGPTVSAEGFELDIANADGSYKKTHEYDPENTNIELPEGDYTVTAHSPGECEATSKAAYYSGKQSFEITAGETEPVSVVCKMANTKIQVTFDNSLKDAFKSWTVTVTPVGVQYMAYPFEGTSADFKQPDAIFWMLPDNVRTIRVEFQGVNSEGKNVTVSYSFEKPVEADSEYWTGADALAIKVNSQETAEDNPSGVNGVTIDAEVTWDELEDNVTIPVEGTPTEPTDPSEPGTGTEEPDEPATGDGGIVISDGGTGYLTDGVVVNNSKFPDDVAVNMTIPKGIKSVFVKIKTTDMDGFGSIIGDMGLMDGDGMDLASEEAAGLSELFELPTANATDYRFTMSGTLFGLLGNFKGTHDFELTVIDNEGNDASAKLTITIN